MEAEENTLNLVQKLAKIRAMSEIATKSKQGYNYTYTDVTEILAKVTSGMKKYNVSLIPSIVPQTANVSQLVSVNTKIDRQGNAKDVTTTEMLFTADMTFRWINDDNPEEHIDVPWFITGSMSDCSQSLGAACSYGMRQFLTSYFQIAQSSDLDVDAYRSKQKEAEAAESKAIAGEIISKFDSVNKQFITDNPERAAEVKKFVSRYVKNAEYTKIKDPALAAKLLEDYTNTFINKE
jgi:ERF superfamily.